MDRAKAKEHLNTLLAEAKDIYRDEILLKAPELAKKNGIEKLSAKAVISTPQRYHFWYTQTVPLIRQLGAERFGEFVGLYEPEAKRKDINWLNYRLQDYMLGTTTRNFEAYVAFSSLFQQQIMIAEAIVLTAEQRLNDLESIVRSDLFRHELDVAEELLSKKHLRAAGALAGVTLETHLRKVCEDRKIDIKKKNATISDFYDLLKQNSIIDVPTWRLLQRLGDIRNLCVHSKERDPTKDEVTDLIVGTKKTLAEIF